MRVDHHQQVQRLQAPAHLRHPGDRVAAVAEGHKALMLLGWSISPGFARTASNQRVVGMPFVSINSLEAKRPFSQS